MKIVEFISGLAAVVAAAMPAVAQQPAPQAYRMVIRAHAGAGGRCLDVPFAHFAVGMRLQTWDCNNGAAQVFVYDMQSQELKIGSLCVESWGRGDPQDAVGLGACNGAAQQHWRMMESKDYYQIIGINNRCLELRYAVKDRGAALDITDCDANKPWRLWALIEAPAGCQTDDFTYSVPYSRSATTNSVITGGGACIYGPRPGPQVEWTSLSITEQPQNGTFEKTGEYEFKYQPKSGFKGQDEVAIRACGHNTDHSGCATITFRVTVN
jgi:hypothetical protein